MCSRSMPMPVSATVCLARPVVTGAPRHGDAPALGRVPHGVVDDVGDGAEQFGFVARDLHRAVGRDVQHVAAGRQRGGPPEDWASSFASGTQRSLGGRGLPSSCASVSRSATSVCMRWVCCPISISTRLRSTSVSGRLPMVSMKPATTVSGERISWDTFATKSRRITSARSRWVTSCDSTRRRPSPYVRIEDRQGAARAGRSP